MAALAHRGATASLQDESEDGSDLEIKDEDNEDGSIDEDDDSESDEEGGEKKIKKKREKQGKKKEGEDAMLSGKKIQKPRRTKPQRVCMTCGSRSTPQWRSGPLGRGTLCNA